MATKKSHHVISSPSGGWNVKKSGSSKASKHFREKIDAENWGREVSRNQRTEFVVHGKDGKIQRIDSHGYAPIPPKDK